MTPPLIKSIPLFTTIFLSIFTLFPSSSSSTAIVNATTNNKVIPPSTACSLTTYPFVCKSLFPPRSRFDLYGYGQFLVKKSLDLSSAFSSVLEETIRGNITIAAPLRGALRDCLFLSQLNTDFLSVSSNTINSIDANALQDVQGEKIHTLLSAVITNQRTCHDGLVSASSSSIIKNSLYGTLFNGSLLYSLSLAMFTHSWAPKTRPGNARVDGAPKWVNPGVFNLNPRMDAPQSVGLSIMSVVTVAKDGSGNYTTIGDAVAAGPNNTDVGNSGYYVIHVKAGVYDEIVTIDKWKMNILMVGDGIDQTVITGRRSVGDGATSTFNSAIFAVAGQNFVAMNLTIRNTAGPAKGQAVAARNCADLSVFYRCSIEAYQDTLYAHSLRQFYRECDIYGTVDFIFGDAAVVFQNCNLYARLPLPGQANMITAQGRSDPNQSTGTSIINCTILAAPDLSADNGSVRSFLGRPWKEFSRTVYIESFMDDLIDPAGWSPWSENYSVSTLYYGEFNNHGPGASTGSRVNWPGYHMMDASDATNFTVASFVQGDVWLPATMVPFFPGLV